MFLNGQGFLTSSFLLPSPCSVLPNCLNVSSVIGLFKSAKKLFIENLKQKIESSLNNLPHVPNTHFLKK